MLQEKGAYKVVEVRRDIPWEPGPAKAKMFTPERVIESVQNDGTEIYELFAPGKPKEPAAEISAKDGKSQMLTERWNIGRGWCGK